LDNKIAGRISLEIKFVPDDLELIRIHRDLNNILKDRKKMIADLEEEIKKEKEAPPRPKIETLLLKQILDVVADQTKRKKEEIEKEIEEFQRPFLQQISDLNKKYEDQEKISMELRGKQIRLMESVNLISEDLNLMKNLILKGSLEINLKELKFEKENNLTFFIIINIGNKVEKTNPQKIKKIDQKFIFPREKETTVMFQIIEKGVLGETTLGFGGIDLSNIVIKNEMKEKEEVFLFKRGQKIGVLDIEYNFIKN
jgi:hypothetical protein